MIGLLISCTASRSKWGLVVEGNVWLPSLQLMVLVMGRKAAFPGFIFIIPHLCSCSVKAATENVQTNECSWVPVKLYSWTVIFDFQILFCHDISLFFQNFSTIWNAKASLCFWSIKTQVWGSTWPENCGLLTLNHSLLSIFDFFSPFSWAQPRKTSTLDWNYCVFSLLSCSLSLFF